MLNINRIKLINFQKHSNLELSLTPNVNVIIGNTDSGKSCVIRSLRWILFPSELKGNSIRKEGSKKTIVEIELENHTIIRRIKSNSINAYQLIINNEEKEYNTVGHNLPEDIQKVLNIRTINIDNESLILNIANQLELPFLFTKSGSYRNKLFNLLTGNDIIDNVFQELNKDLLQIGREEKNQQSNLEELTKFLTEINTNIEINQKIYDNFSTHYENLKKVTIQYNKLYTLSDNLNLIKTRLSEAKEKISSIKLIKDEQIKLLKQKIDKFYNLEKLYESYAQIREDLEEVNISLIDIKIPKINIKELKLKVDRFEKISSLQKELKQIKNSLQQVDSSLINIQLPTANITELKTKINKLEILKELEKKYKQIIESKEDIDIKLIEAVELIEKKEKEYKKILKDLGVCPLCKQEIK